MTMNAKRPVAKTRERSRLKIMVASTVYAFEDQLDQINAILAGYGYEVWNSHSATIPVHPGKSNLDNCLAAVRDCDLFIGIIRPFYGSGVIGDRSITHEEVLAAIRSSKPRWFLVHRDVTFARQLLKQYMYSKEGIRLPFAFQKTPVLDDLRVIDLYNDAIRQELAPEDRIGHWAQEFHRLDEILTYLKSQFEDRRKIQTICGEMRRP